MSAKLRLVGSSPVTENGTKRKMPNRRENDRLRGRFHLTEAEVRLLKETALRDNLYGLRDATMISLAFRSCLRINELLGKQALQWSDINWERGTIHIRRLKGSDDSTHRLQGDMIRSLRRLKREQEPPSPFIFTSERGAPLSPAAFRKMFARLGKQAGIPFPVNPHSLRHGGLTHLACDGADAITLAAYAGHRQLQNLKRYISLSSERFKNFRWDD
jgi:type 1 fimbriae regulatory protein FimB/type 1 fimbriae regulatory protein FimE